MTSLNPFNNSEDNCECPLHKRKLMRRFKLSCATSNKSGTRTQIQTPSFWLLRESLTPLREEWNGDSKFFSNLLMTLIQTPIPQ